MAYTPVDGSNIVANFLSGSVYTPASGSNIVANFNDEVPIYKRAIILSQGMLREILDSEKGTGLKPLVMLADGAQKQRQTTEGVPLVTGYLRQLLNNETLLI